MGAADSVGSPAFTIVNEYRTSAGEILYHIDFIGLRNKKRYLISVLKSISMRELLFYGVAGTG
jgi:tRNA A37 threonylcarbamoyladenosine biosynthesis protein TsaE